uniref:DUF4230 domain-containing protein n=1 Tax=Prevotella sp. GTC17253 TaxID=3236793 RepID=A0AB33IXV6_9BACT
MEQPHNHPLLTALKHMSKAVWITIISIFLLIAIAISIVIWYNRDNHIAIHSDNRIDISPTQIRSIENIGEWEFLSISDEELVDTIKRGFFGDSKLVRIYYGTLRMGLNLHEATPGWIKTDGDTLRATLPPIKLLDHDFIDETKTQSFYEEGKWTNADREALYRKAYRLMKQRCLTPQNIDNAQENATRQFYSLFKSMGFENVRIKFQDNKME